VAPIYAMAKRVQLAEFFSRGNHWHHILLCMYSVAHRCCPLSVSGITNADIISCYATLTDIYWYECEIYQRSIGNRSKG